MSRRPPTTDEFHNLILLGQALAVLAAPADVQAGLYPAERSAAGEMRTLFRDALDRVRGVFWPAFAPELRDALECIDALLEVCGDTLAGATWDALREAAGRAASLAPGSGTQAPRSYAEQFIWFEGRLRERARVARS